MANFTSNTYTLKRKILTFSNKISNPLSKPERKFVADMTCGILASGSCLLTDIVDQLHEPSKKINSVDRLSRHLAKGTSKEAVHSYLTQVKTWCPDQPVIHIDDSDVVKPDVFYRGKKHNAYLSHIKVQITASRKDIFLVLVYGITQHPMMLATNKEIKSKEDVVQCSKDLFLTLENRRIFPL